MTTWIVGIITAILTAAGVIVAYLALPQTTPLAQATQQPHTTSSSRPKTRSPDPSSTKSDDAKPLVEMDLQSTDQGGDSWFSYTTGEARVQGKQYSASLIAEASCLDYGANINLLRKYRTFTATVALLDSSGIPEDPIPFAVFVDGKQVRTVSVSLGEDKAIKVDVSGAFRLTITTELRAKGLRCQPEDVSAAWLDPALHR
ncbi:NPCBM/NEW2 domain-containing protein [Nonomuraea sp. NEAU-A123]|uniref:NPCBM/NEW2 domain-containing protein n=1 Tax=Nonomuraea sp. NEAU-A123 TaxID=2839649 RepID=UPI001BE413BE|nr:NPCBM/NEW2 domain-containing protein [Nonomuraea sp. NEAU-A123]MBT2234996.1 NPCBM/NEW2 domain-containing protein [Nonomuraea sp. NEAU-A123]